MLARFEGVDWDVEDCRALARDLLCSLETRWRHVEGVAARAVELEANDLLVSAAWLHDIGYAPGVVDSGMHAIDGAKYLVREGAPEALVSLVAFHTGAAYEAEERGLEGELDGYALPGQGDLDLLTFADLTTASNGGPIGYRARIDEIFRRYPPHHPVHRAVRRSRASLELSCQRVASSTGYPM